MPSVPGAPIIDWVAPNVPLGASVIELAGRNFDDPGLSVEIQASGTKLSTRILANNQGTLLVEPTWPDPATTAGSATVTAMNSLGASIPKGIDLKDLGYRSVSKVDFVIGGFTSLSLGQLAGQPTAFAFSYNTVWGVSYNGATGVFQDACTNLLGGLYVTAPADLDGDATTDFVGVDALSNDLKTCRYGTSYDCPAADVAALNLRLTTSVSALTTGATSQNRALIALASRDKKLYRCFYLKTAKTAQPCAPVAGFSDTARTLIVKPFAPAGAADVVVLNQTGQISLWRSDAADSFSLCADCIDQAVAGRSFVAMAAADLDGQNGPDLVAVDSQGIVVFRNDGQGKLKAGSTSVPNMPVATAIRLGDLDGDAKADMILVDGAGKLWLWLNQSDGAYGSAKLSGLVAVKDTGAGKQISLGAGALLILDGQDDGSFRRPITVDAVNSGFAAWENALQP